MNIVETVKYVENKLIDGKINDYQIDAKYLVAKVLDMDVSHLLMHYSDNVDDHLFEKILNLTDKRIEGVPLQYLLGEWDFYSLNFFVGPGVLIPRPETELLCDVAIKLIDENNYQNCCDLCSGTGCIPIAITNNRNVHFDAYEKYDDAFAYLEKNIAKHNAVNVNAIKDDIFVCDVPENKYDLICSNPPYIPLSYKAIIQKEVLFEPDTSLYSDDQCKFYKCICDRFVPHLKENGSIVVEIGYDEKEQVMDIFSKYFSNLKCLKDISGIDRVIYGTMKR